MCRRERLSACRASPSTWRQAAGRSYARRSGSTSVPAAEVLRLFLLSYYGRIMPGCTRRPGLPYAEDVNTRLDLYGDNGGLSFEPLTLYREEQGAMTHTKLLFKPNDCFQEQAEHFAQVVLGQAQPLAPAQDGVMVERMLEGLYRSAMSGEEVRL